MLPDEALYVHIFKSCQAITFQLSSKWKAEETHSLDKISSDLHVHGK